MLRRLGVFLKRVIRWWATITGGVVALLLLLIQLPNIEQHLPRSVCRILPTLVWLIVLAALFVAFFRAWNIEFEMRVSIQKRLILASLQNIHTSGSLTTTGLAQTAWCSEEEVKPVIEDLVREKLLGRGRQAGTWTYSAVANSPFGNFVKRQS